MRYLEEIVAAVHELPVPESMVNNSLLTQRKFPEVIRQPYADDSSSDGENSARDDDFADTSNPVTPDDTELKRQQAAERDDEERKTIQG